jgi:hypothetical protein
MMIRSSRSQFICSIDLIIMYAIIDIFQIKFIAITHLRECPDDDESIESSLVLMVGVWILLLILSFRYQLVGLDLDSLASLPEVIDLIVRV